MESWPHERSECFGSVGGRVTQEQLPSAATRQSSGQSALARLIDCRAIARNDTGDINWA